MRRIKVQDKVLKIHFRTNNKNIEKVLSLIELYLEGKVYTRRLDINHSRVIDVSYTERIVIIGSTFHYMNHEQYNKFISR